MRAHHGTTKTGLAALTPFANAHNELSEACVYLAQNKALALLHIWDKPYRWVKFDYAKDGRIVWLEPYPNALEAFYGGVAGSIYTCEGKFRRLARNVLISNKAVAVVEEEYVPDALVRIVEYERQGLLEIRRCEDQSFTAKPMQKEHIPIVVYLLREESLRAALQLEETSSKQWEKALRRNLRDRDEANFIIYRGGRPMGWLKLNGLKGDTAWISMLAIHPALQRQGAGRFAVEHAERLALEKGFTRVGIKTTPDNAAARACYEKLGYTLTEEADKLTYIKHIGRNA